MRKLTATLCLTIAALFICAIVKNANAEDKFYAFSVNDVRTTWEAILSIRDKNLEVSISFDCPACTRFNAVEMTCQNAEIGLKNNFKTWCNYGVGGSYFFIDKMSGNLEKAKFEGSGSTGDAVFHFIPFSQKKSFETFRKKTSAISTEEFVAALAAKQKAGLERQREIELAREETAQKKAKAERRRREKLQRQREIERARTTSAASLGRVPRDLREHANAMIYLADVRDFVSLNPKELDPLLLAQTFTPAMQELRSHSFNKNGSSFLRLVAYTLSSAPFREFLAENRQKRAEAEARERAAITKVIIEKVDALKKRISSDPLAPAAFRLSQLIVKYEKIPKGESTDALRKLRYTLENDMKKVGVSSPNANPAGDKTTRKDF